MEKINGVLFKQMLESGMNNLSTNMHLTVSNGVKEALKTNSDSVKDIAKTLSRGLLMGARGNSGVITSQIFRGIYQAVEDLPGLYQRGIYPFLYLWNSGAKCPDYRKELDADAHSAKAGYYSL